MGTGQVHHVVHFSQTCLVFNPGRTFPQSIPAYMVCLENTLGAKQGTLFRAPRGAEKPVADDNVFTRSDYWNLLACKPEAPLSPGPSNKLQSKH